MGMISEFKEFAVKGNVIDLAVGVIVGGAFGKIVSSVVSDVLMPPIGMMIGGVDFKDFVYVLKEKAGDLPAVTIKYGSFIQTMIDFLIVAISVFIMVKFLTTFKKPVVPAPAPGPSKEEVLLAEIRDLLKAKN